MTTSAALREIRRATRHHGVTTTAQLQLTQRQIDTCCRNGTLLRLHRGVYADPAHPRTPLQDVAVAVAAGGPQSGATGRSGAAIWGCAATILRAPKSSFPTDAFEGSKASRFADRAH